MGVVMRLITTKNEKPILDGWSFDVYGGNRKEWEDLKKNIPTVGVAVEKKLYKNKLIELGGAVLVTTPVYDFLNKTTMNIAGGITVKF